jgi:hypothetical protein
MAIEKALILILRDVTQESQVPGLGMKDSMQAERPRAHLVVMDGQVGIKLAGYTLE